MANNLNILNSWKRELSSLKIFSDKPRKMYIN